MTTKKNTTKNAAPKTKLPQSYAITKSTPTMVAILREAFSNNKGKLFTIADLQKITGKKWINGFLYYASRARLEVNAPCDFPIVAVKKDRVVVGYRHQPLVNESDADKKLKYRNTKGHVVKPTNIVGKWEARDTQKAVMEAAATEQNNAAAA